MKYIVKILTPDCVDKVNDLLDSITDSTNEQIKIRDLLYSHWQFPQGALLINKLLSTFGLEQPEYTERLFWDKRLKGEVEARILWKGKVTKIVDIDEIYAFSTHRRIINNWR